MFDKIASLWGLLWVSTLLVCSWMVGSGLVKPKKIIEWPFLVGLIVMYFYVYMALNAVVTFQSILSDDDATQGQFVALLCLVFIALGWSSGASNSVVRQEGRSYSAFKLWLSGTVLMFVASSVYQLFLSALESDNQLANVTFENSSAYWFLCFYLGYPGFAVALWAICKMNPAQRKLVMPISILVLAYFMFPHIYNARRGPLFPSVMILLFVPPFAKRQVPNRALFLTGMVGCGLVMLAFLEVRKFVYNDGTWGQAVSEVTLSNVVTSKVNKASDNEYINSCVFIATLNATGKYQFGTGHLGLFAHWIPRSIWTSKPALGEGFYSSHEILADVNSRAGWNIIGGGAAAGGFADSFMQYGYATPFFWFIFSRWAGIAFKRARLTGDPVRLSHYLMVICVSHWLLSQGFAAAFVPGTVFLIVSRLLLYFAETDSQVNSSLAANER